ncbi:FAD-dependent monooxygenase [Streptomyces sp. NPDC002309]
MSSRRSDSAAPQRSSVVVVGAGPAGMTLGSILRTRSADRVVLAAGSGESIEQQPRAGALEERGRRGPKRRGLAGNLLERAAPPRHLPGGRLRSHGAVPGRGLRVPRPARATVPGPQSCSGRPVSRWSARFSASSTTLRRWPSHRA